MLMEDIIQIFVLMAQTTLLIAKTPFINFH